MGVIYVLITVSLVIAIIFFIAFIKSVKSGQYDDSVTPSYRILFDNKPTAPSDTNKSNKS